jgi:low affinity Fe/Cu permease
LERCSSPSRRRCPGGERHFFDPGAAPARQHSAMLHLLAEDSAAMPIVFQVAAAVLLLLCVILLGGLVVNVNKSIKRITAILRHLEESRDTGVGAQMNEAIAQLQSMAVSLDRVAMRCDAIETRVAEASAKGGTVGDAGLAQAVTSLREGIDQLRAPVGEIRDRMAKTEVERLGDEVKRTLYSMGYDTVVIRTELASLAGGDGKVHVEVARGGVKSKGYLVLRGGSTVETKISPTYEMFP